MLDVVEVLDLARKLNMPPFSHVKRAENEVADGLTKEGVSQKSVLISFT